MSEATAWLDRLERASARLTHRIDDDGAVIRLMQGLVEDLAIEHAEVWLSKEDVGFPRPVFSTRSKHAQEWHRAAEPPHAPPSVMEALRSREAVLVSRPGSDCGDEMTAAPTSGAEEACLAVPLLFDGRPYGVWLVSRKGAFPPEAVSALTVIARQLATALGDARIIAESRAERETSARRLDRLSALGRITHQLLAADELAAVVQIVAESASRLCDASGAMVELIDDDRRHLTVLSSYGEPAAFFVQFHASQLTDDFFAETAAGQALLQRRSVVVEDYATWATRYELKPLAVTLGVRAIIAAPLLVDSAPIGVLWVCDVTSRAFTVDDVAMVEALADQAALAIQHTRLRTRSEEAAVLEERARLARDLHDSATQSVFSTQLMANAAYVQHQRGVPALAGTLARLRTISQDALSELRALLYELRPTALEEEGLASALAKLVTAMQVRTEVPIRYQALSSARPEAGTGHAIFRIVQEALANATKYARASTIDVSMEERNGLLSVTVADDGGGFDPAAPPTPSGDGRRGGMGLRSMRERAVAAGLRLLIDSAPGAGCRVTIEAPLDPEDGIS
jgi:signal transduction histidine kinase